MAGFKFLLDNDVRHLQAVLPPKQTVMLEDVGLEPASPDDDVVVVASGDNLLIVTNNRRDFEHKIKARIAASTKKENGCTQVHGLVVVVPTEAISQTRSLVAASKNLFFEGKRIGWKNVHEWCLKVVIPKSGIPVITRLPRCPHCLFTDAKAS
jgi:hypothetical protein